MLSCASVRRCDLEHALRFGKQCLGWTLPRVAPLPFAALDQPVRLQNPEANTLRRTYIRCIDGVDLAEVERPYLIRARTQPAWDHREFTSTHLAPVVAP